MSPRVDRPIFFCGMPRSGTTVAFEAFASRRDVAWLSQHIERAPGLPMLAVLSRTTDLSASLRRSVSRSDQRQPWREKLKVGPSEAYAFWRRCCGEKFVYDYLLGSQATAAERDCARSAVMRVQRFHGKPRFAAKITGPARIGYLLSIFPDARFVHVVRDGRAVVQSLLRVPFWRERSRRHEPAWRNGLTASDIADWERWERSPLALAAVQWRRVVTAARDEASRLARDRYCEVHYERFMSEPNQVLDEIASFCELPASAEAREFLRGRFELRNMNYQWSQRFDASQVATLDDLLASTLRAFGYELVPPRLAPGGRAVERPFSASA